MLASTVPTRPRALALWMRATGGAARRLGGFHAPDGSETGRLSAAVAGAARPIGLAFGADGTLHLFDDESGVWLRLP